MEINSALYGSLDGKGLGENGHMYMDGWVPSRSPETTAALLIGYTPTQNIKFEVWKKN